MAEVIERTGVYCLGNDKWVVPKGHDDSGEIRSFKYSDKIKTYHAGGVKYYEKLCQENHIFVPIKIIRKHLIRYIHEPDFSKALTLEEFLYTTNEFLSDNGFDSPMKPHHGDDF